MRREESSIGPAEKAGIFFLLPPARFLAISSH